MEKKKFYRIHDLCKVLDRDKTTILRWEKQGFIPKAKRDSRGWRIYSEEEFHLIVNKIKEARRYNRKVASIVLTLIFAINIIAFFTLSHFALSNANTNVNLNITAGTLTVTASTTAEFPDTSYSLNVQTTTLSAVGGVGVADNRGGDGVWTFNLSCNDNTEGACQWRGPTENDRIQMSEDIASSTAPNTKEGIFCVDFTNWRCVSVAGDSCDKVTLSTGYKCFPYDKTDIQLATGNSANGEYWFAESSWQQGIPAGASAVSYTTVLTYDLQ